MRRVSGLLCRLSLTHQSGDEGMRGWISLVLAECWQTTSEDSTLLVSHLACGRTLFVTSLPFFFFF